MSILGKPSFVNLRIFYDQWFPLSTYPVLLTSRHIRWGMSWQTRRRRWLTCKRSWLGQRRNWLRLLWRRSKSWGRSKSWILEEHKCGSLAHVIRIFQKLIWLYIIIKGSFNFPSKLDSTQTLKARDVPLYFRKLNFNSVVNPKQCLAWWMLKKGKPWWESWRIWRRSGMRERPQA